MNTFATKFSSTGPLHQLRKANTLLDDEEGGDAMWGSTAGFGTLSKGVPTFNVPNFSDVRTHLRVRKVSLTHPSCSHLLS